LYEWTVRNPAPGNLSLAETAYGNGRFVTVGDIGTVMVSMDGIEWCSTNNSTPCALQNISVPVLITAMGAHFFIRDNEVHYEMAASKDKDFVVIEGATHGISPCKECESTPGQYGNSVKNFFDYLAKWMKGRY
jgi:hypothetical protein